MVAVVSKNGDVLLKCEFDLERVMLVNTPKRMALAIMQWPFEGSIRIWVLLCETHNLGDIILAPRNDDNARRRGFQIRPAGCQRRKLSSVREVDLGRGR
jgi:hypothetical protein